MITSEIFDMERANVEPTYEKNASVFKAFCDEKRLRILELLRTGEKCTCVLIEEMEMPQSSLSYHMKILCESGVVEGRQDGKWTHYHISDAGSLRAMELLKELTSTAPSQENSSACCGE